MIQQVGKGSICDGISLEGLDLGARIARFRKAYVDCDGNKVIFTKRKHFWRVDLYLPKNEYKKMRCIGRVSQDKKGNIKYKVQKYYLDHRYKETDSIGFNDTLIHNILDDKDKVTVHLKDTGEKLNTTVGIIKKYGTYRRYKDNGLERQVFLKLDSFTS